MPDLNLMRYYLRLESLGYDGAVSVSLTEISELLFTSLRHARTLLGKMHSAGWVVWQPKPGRNQRSSITLQYSPDGLKQFLAASFIESGHYEKALNLLDHNKVVFASLLQQTSGATMREGVLHVQLTYKRKFEALLPHHVQRSSERFLLRQVFSCLVSCSSKGELQPQLAHHWQYDEVLNVWTFYLRPGLTFHDGKPIEAKPIAQMFEQLKTLPFYQSELSHVEEVYSPQPLRLCFKLSQPDKGFGGLLAGVKYSIQPLSQLKNVDVKQVVGSGPFKVSEHNEDKLKLIAFEHYYGCRSLTDEVTIWQFEEQMAGSARFDDSQMQVAAKNEISCFHHLGKDDTQQDQSDLQSSRVEDGCLFVLFNQREVLNQNTHKAEMSLEQRKYLSQLLSPEAIQAQLEKNSGTFSVEYARNLLPKWRAVLKPPVSKTVLPKKLSIAVYNYYALYRCAVSIADLLKTYGVEVEINTYSFRDLTLRSEQQTLTEDLILCNVNLDDNAHSSLFSWLMNNPVLHFSLGAGNSQWLQTRLNQHKASVKLEDYFSELEPIASCLVSEYWMLPMFHHLQTVRFQGILKNIAITNWGWPQFRDVWSAD
ncbi:SgrR family transcriptional regulator [Vibrio makurazakiensis]|uniref:SgrR family transcriptional regulator n=1 Tax=Vibrio makurazakiensis TaxID=2910250 RepID=UPI003D0FF1F7